MIRIKLNIEIDEVTLTMVRSTFMHVSVKAGLPSNVEANDMKNYQAPTLLIVGEKDLLFPGEAVIERAKTLMPDLTTHVMIDSGHLSNLSLEKHQYIIPMIIEFIEKTV